MIGTYILVLLGPGSIVAVSLLPSISPVEALLIVAGAFGGTVTAVIVVFGRHSGSHINPAISLASVLTGALRRELMIPYLTFQFAGAILAGLSLRLIFSSATTELGSTRLASSVSPAAGIVLEAAGTFVLAFSALAVSHVADSRYLQAVMVGSTLFVLIVLIGPLTGAGFNPARSFGPALWSGYMSNQLIYWVGPFVGAACAGLTFGLLGTGNSDDKRRKLDIVCVC
jgi:MIP family channel proteins